MNLRFNSLLVSAVCFAATFARGENVIVSGAEWKDTAGNPIQAHGGGLLKVNGGNYFWFGEDKSHNSGLFKAVSCYESSDLMNWSRRNDALTPIPNTLIGSNTIVERPKVIYNKKNAEYVMWFHSDSSNYGAATLGVAVSKTPCGPYTYRSSWRPFGAESRDQGLFVDDDAAQTAYVLYASDNNQNFKISRLDANYYNVTQQINSLVGTTLESPGIIKKNGVYHLFASKTTGWEPNPNKVFTSNSLSGTFGKETDIAPNALRTYFSQNTYNLPLGNNAVYLGDRWRPSMLGSSRYVWYPLVWSSGSPKIVPADVWTINIAAGTYTVLTGTTYEAERGVITAPARLMSLAAFSGGQGVGYLGNGGSVQFQNVIGKGTDQWVSLYYGNGDSSWRSTTVSVNGGPLITVDQPDTRNPGNVLSVPVKLNLRNGANTISISTGQTNYAGDLDKIIVY